MSKPRSDSKLKNLPEERQQQIVEWASTPKSETCVGGLKYAQQQLAADGIKVSLAALSGFLSWWELQQQFSAADIAAKFVEEQMASFDPSNVERAAAAGQFVFTNLSLRHSDPKTFVALQRLDLDKRTAATKAKLEERKLALAERRVKVAERKLDQLKGILTDGDLTLEEREARMKAAFGIA